MTGHRLATNHQQVRPKQRLLPRPSEVSRATVEPASRSWWGYINRIKACRDSGSEIRFRSSTNSRRSSTVLLDPARASRRRPSYLPRGGSTGPRGFVPDFEVVEIADPGRGRESIFPVFSPWVSLRRLDWRIWIEILYLVNIWVEALYFPLLR